MKTGIPDLLLPHFLAGFDLPESIHNIVSFLKVNELQSAWDENGVVYSGLAAFTGEGDASPVPKYKAPSGSLIEWDDINIRFRLTIPRRGSAQIREVMSSVDSLASDGDPIDQLDNALERMEINATTFPSDYPGFQWQLEMLVSAVTLHLPKSVFLPARLAADGWLEPDTSIPDVRISLPKIAFVVSQGEEIGSVDIDFKGWGINSLDDPSDPAAGEMIRMTPPLALHESGIVGFGMEKIVLDLSEDFTPPEILEMFGTGDDFKGLWLPHVRFFLAPGRTTGFAFDLRAKDLLIDFKGEVSGEFGLEVIRRNSQLSVEPVFWQGDQRREVTRGAKTVNDKKITVKGSRASVAADGDLQIAISGGMAPYIVTVKRDGTIIPPQNHNGDVNRKFWPLGSPAEGTATIEITIKDSSAAPASEWTETIELTILPAGKVIGSTTTYPPPTVTGACPKGYTIVAADMQPDPDAVLLKVTPSGNATYTITSGGSGNVPTSGELRVPVTAGGATVEVTVKWPAAPIPPYIAQYSLSTPVTAEIGSYTLQMKDDPALLTFLQQAGSSPISIEGNASFEGRSEAEESNRLLSERRITSLENAINQLAGEHSELTTPVISVKTILGTARPRPATVSGAVPEQPGFKDDPKFQSHPILGSVGSYNEPSYKEQYYWTAIATCDGSGSDKTCTVSVSRPAAITKPVVTPSEKSPTPQEPEKPSLFRSIALRARLERNLLVLAEVKGELDFQTEAEKLAGRIQSDPGTGLQVGSNPGASSQPDAKGILDYRLTLSYDSAARKLTQQLALGFDRQSKDGWLFVKGFEPKPLSNSLGALAIFAPLIAKSIDSAVSKDGKEAIADIVIAAAEVAVALALGATGAIEMQKFIFYGGELTATESLPGYMKFDGANFEELSVMIDYAVDFGIHINIGPVKINSAADKPLRVRYKAIGFKFDFSTNTLHPVFDTSKGYQFDLADPGLLSLGPPMDDILKLLGARVSKLNPLLLEFDIGMKVNLGVITVESFRVTLPINDGSCIPYIVPTGISVKIPGTIIGKGFLDLRDGIKGQLDLTLIPLKLRIAAGVGIEKVTAEDGRKLTGVIISLIIEFPAAVPLGGTGLGLYGILGLFAMHYRRKETEDTSITIPALHWLNNPPVSGNPVNIQGWGAAADRWAFGAGVVLGSMEGGYLINLKGMLMLELPGPRILIFTNAKILSGKPETEGAITGGILAVVDLDFARHRLTIGILVDYSVKEVITIKIPVEAFFSTEDISNWHLYLGKISARITAQVLGGVKAEGYLMIAGHDIPDFPWVGSTITLKGFAVALGLRASIVLGNKSSGIYLQVSAGMDVAVSFNPFRLYGIIELRGELHLIILSISAWATLAVEAPDPTYMVGEACGEIDFFFFSIKGCVRISIGSQPGLPEPPDLIRGMILQSRTPALVEGSGADRPVDASLGEAFGCSSIDTQVPDDKRIVVPIDSIPIFNLHASPELAGDFSSFTTSPGQATRLLTGGWIPQSENLWVRYEIQSVTIDPPLPASDLGPPPAAWRAISAGASKTDTSIDLALMSWMPEHFSRAIERSTELTDRVTHRWGNTCRKIAPPACQMWNFCRKPLGYSSVGWTLDGERWPDPPGTYRSAEPPKKIHIHEEHGVKSGPLLDQMRAALTGNFLDHAKIIGGKVSAGKENKETYTARVLELPCEFPTGMRPGYKIPAEYHEFITKETQKIVVESGCMEQIRLLLALRAPERTGKHVKWVVFRAFDDQDNLTEEVIMEDIVEKVQPVMTDYPHDWQDTTGPWYNEVNDVHHYLALGHPALTRYLVGWNLKHKIRRFEIVVGHDPSLQPPSLMVGLIQMCSCEEATRFEYDERSRQTDIANVQNALLGDRLRPLLQPGNEYAIGMKYLAQVKKVESDGSEAITPFDDQEVYYKFFTDNKPPERLNPWVLLTTPEADEPCFFTEDPVRIIFNDASAIQLWQEYGKSLKAVLRRANGNHPEEQPTITPDVLYAIDAQILTPFEETLRELVGSLPCVVVGASEQHRVFRFDMPLDRGMYYTLDVEQDPADPPLVPPEPRMPLLRIAFKTSRFTGAAELAEYIAGATWEDRLLTAPFPALPETPSELQLEEAFRNSGLGVMPPAADPRIISLWESSGSGYVRKAILIDSPEPLWRFRQEPEKESTDTETGLMERWVMKPVRYLELAETGPSSIVGFVRSPGGTRTIVMLPSTATELRLFLRQRDIGLEGGTVTDHPLFDTPMSPGPVWVMNEIKE